MTKDYIPMRIVFKFPGEHLVEGSRYDGEIVVQFQEVVENDDMVFIKFNKQ